MTAATAAAGALGGAGAEDGSEYRARVGALISTALIRRTTLEDLGVAIRSAVPVLLQAESDDPVDDLVVTLASGSRVFVQVKLRAGLHTNPGSPLGTALNQFAAAVRAGVAADDTLVLACAHPTREVARLRTLLERRRYAAQGRPTRGEQKAWDDFVRLATACGLSAGELDRVAAHLVIWPTDPMTGDGEGLLVARLEGHVVVSGEGLQAARDLSDEVRVLARARAGRDATQFAQALLSRGRQLVSNAPPSSPVAWVRELATYRARVVRDGTTLRLFGAPAELRNLPLTDADAGVEVTLSGDDRGIGVVLEPTLRRRGRVLVVGRAGGGKSTALRAVAARWARCVDWPIPIFVHLQRLAARPGEMLDALLDAAVAHVGGTDQRAALRAALSNELASGRCLLLLDGLDEVRLGRAALVSDLADMLRDLDDGVEVVIAARPVAADDARPLGLPQLDLQPPRHARETVDAILRAAAPPDDPEAWISARRLWVEASFERDSALGNTPLTIVVLTLIAVRSQDPGELPHTRAGVLHRALTDVVDRWELEAKRRGEVKIGRLSGSSAQDALFVALRVLSSAAISTQPPEDTDARHRVSAALAVDFGLASGEARAAAHDAVVFWLDVGLFSFDGGTLAATIRQLAELGHAWGPALEGRPEPAAWVADARRSRDLWASLALGAGLSLEISELWASAVVAEGDADEVIALVDSLRDGATVTDDTLSAVIEATTERHLTSARDAELVAEAFLFLPLPSRTRQALRPALTAAVPAERRSVVDVLAIVQWNEQGRDVDDQLRAFVAAPAPPLPEDLRPPKPEPGVLVIPSTDDMYREALREAMLRVLALSRQDAELVSERFDDGSLEFRSRLEAAFTQAGHPDLSDAVNADLRDLQARNRELHATRDFHGDLRAMLGVVEEIATPASLTQRELRRMDALADLFETASLQWTGSGWPTRRAETATAWVRAMAELSGFDLGVLAAQAAALQAEMHGDDHAWHLIFDEGIARDPEQWSRTTDQAMTLRHLVEAIGHVPSQASGQLRCAIATAPDHAQAVRLLEARVDRVGIWARALAAKILLIAESETDATGTKSADERARGWLVDEDPMLREAAAMWWAFRTPTTRGRELERALADDDANVAIEAVRGLRVEDIDDRLRPMLESLRDAPPPGWLCRWCGQVNQEYDRSGCAQCKTSAPRIREEITKLFGDHVASSVRFARSARRTRPRPAR